MYSSVTTREWSTGRGCSSKRYLRGKTTCSEERLRHSLDVAAPPLAQDPTAPFDLSGPDAHPRADLRPRRPVEDRPLSAPCRRRRSRLPVRRGAQALARDVPPRAVPRAASRQRRRHRSRSGNSRATVRVFRAAGRRRAHLLAGPDPLQPRAWRRDARCDVRPRGRRITDPVTGFGYRVTSATLAARYRVAIRAARALSQGASRNVGCADAAGPARSATIPIDSAVGDPFKAPSALQFPPVPDLLPDRDGRLLPAARPLALALAAARELHLLHGLRADLHPDPRGHHRRRLLRGAADRALARGRNGAGT